MSTADQPEPRTLAEMVRLQRNARGDEIAFHFEGRDTTFAKFDSHTNQVANGLAALGLKHGDRIAYLGKNSDTFFALWLGAAKAGIVMTPINWRLAPPEVAYIAADSKAAALFVGPEFIEQVRAMKDRLPDVRAVMTTEGGAPELSDFTPWRDSQSSADPAIAVSESDIAIQLYTSGTTGHPKGAMLSHRNFFALRGARATEQPDWNKWSAEDVSLIAMPVFHIGGAGWGFMNLHYGAKGVIAREFDPNKVLDFIETFGISKLFMVPAAMQIVVRLPRAREVDYSRLKYILYGASPIPAALLNECIEVFGCGFVQMYGMTETTGTIVVLPPEDHVVGSPRMRSAGKAVEGVELAILGPDGTPLPPGEVGEIATRSLANMSGYWNLPAATAKTIDAKKWLLTGDAGTMDADGYIYIHDRIKDMIISGGENIYPAEVENAVSDHPAVAEVAVIGVPDAQWGEAVKAMVVTRLGHDASAADIIRFTREKIAAYKCPKSVEFIQALPRNASGKILRRTLREPYWAGKDRNVN